MLSGLKKIIPNSIKYPFWYIFKSPQRKTGFFRSIILELNALLYLATNNVFNSNPKKLKPVSICTGIKNRTENYLEYVLPSILKMHHPQLIEICIFDCGSDDIERLRKKVKEKWKGKLVLVTESQAFTRSYAFNRAIEQASNELFFAADADMTLPIDLVEKCNRNVTAKTLWFPVCFSLYENKPAIIAKENGTWRPEGKGMFAATKAQFEKAGKYNENYKTWGLEDIDLWISFFKSGTLPVRTRCKGLIHHWHPSLEIKVDVPEHMKKLGI